MFTLLFWKALAERSLKTFAQAAAALLIGDGVGLLTVDWVSVGSVAGLAAVISALTSIGTAAATDGSPSMVHAEVLTVPDGTGENRAG